MKKIKFLSGINAMFALAAVALATTFTSCEKEELSFNLKPQVATLTIDATVVVIDDGVTVETKSFTKSETSQPGSSISAGSFAVNHTYTFEDGYVGTINESVEYPTVLPGQNVALTPTFILSHNCVFPEVEEVIEFDFENAVVTEAPDTDELTIVNESDYYWTSTVTWVTKSGIKYVGFETTDDATADEILAIQRYYDGLEDTYKESTESDEYTVYSKTKLEFTVTYAITNNKVNIYRTYVTESATRADNEPVLIGWIQFQDYTGTVMAEPVSYNLDGDGIGHGHGHGLGHGHGHGGENAGGGIIWE